MKTGRTMRGAGAARWFLACVLAVLLLSASESVCALEDRASFQRLEGEQPAEDLTRVEPERNRAEHIRVVARITSRSWLRVSVDGNPVFEGTLEGGERRSWIGTDEVRIRTGNAGGTHLGINGEDIGPMGAAGRIVEQSFEPPVVYELKPGQGESDRLYLALSDVESPTARIFLLGLGDERTPLWEPGLTSDGETNWLELEQLPGEKLRIGTYGDSPSIAIYTPKRGSTHHQLPVLPLATGVPLLLGGALYTWKKPRPCGYAVNPDSRKYLALRDCAAQNIGRLWPARVELSEIASGLNLRATAGDFRLVFVGDKLYLDVPRQLEDDLHLELNGRRVLPGRGRYLLRFGDELTLISQEEEVAGRIQFLLRRPRTRRRNKNPERSGRDG